MYSHRSIVGKSPFTWYLPLGIAYRRSVAPPDPAPSTLWLNTIKQYQEAELCYAGKKQGRRLSKSQTRPEQIRSGIACFFINRNVVRGVGEGRSKRAPVRAYSAEGERRTGLCPQFFGESASWAFLCGRVRRAPGADSRHFPASVPKRTAPSFSHSLTTKRCRCHEKKLSRSPCLAFETAPLAIFSFYFPFLFPDDVPSEQQDAPLPVRAHHGIVCAPASQFQAAWQVCPP
ncbi:hypothetical protein DFP93_103102 [Aneurinibacillus soli]|uniref:Uncharacterized protein n=1 Tax=Aneurinibacillus soli TaxID=1500254 RepID=A0A0U4WKQ2_9BACL|nr:hypothetical protein DFP93_103102 [Aneurinibacillus soli]BAU29048.1 hypothetical protein CB4_03226 [Aneurinibacillus soli]